MFLVTTKEVLSYVKSLSFLKDNRISKLGHPDFYGKQYNNIGMNNLNYQDKITNPYQVTEAYMSFLGVSLLQYSQHKQVLLYPCRANVINQKKYCLQLL